eukprot:TRINITY_DN6023_c0_g1_i1.p1 TRINITY_DN6023_c0_g1~~TRINITY_DN6023_c0_g1_i1.p1  ORF type:complete len:553 (-),score=99.21 TRINITY_DN6023_c0_g1_i1:24-1682(-)
MEFGSASIHLDIASEFAFVFPTNCCTLKIGELVQTKGHKITGDPLFCSSCKAAFNSESTLEKGVWNCEFCSFENKDLILEPEEKPKTNHAEYVQASDQNNDAEAKVNEKETELDDNNEALVLFVIDTSGSMGETYKIDKSWVSRLELVQSAISGQIDYMVKNTPKKKVGFITFAKEVTVYGQKVLKLSGPILNDYVKLLESGQEIIIEESVNQSHERLKSELNKLVPDGATALGPAVTIAMVIAAKHPGSKLIICTDGVANLGLGSLEGKHEQMEAFYHGKVAHYAKKHGVVMNVISIAGSDTRLEYLGMLSDATGGNVDLVQATNVDFSNAIRTVILGTNCHAKVVVPSLLKIICQEARDRSSQNASRISVNLGNITDKTELTLEFSVNEKITTLPKSVYIQLQLTYRKTNGSKVLKTITRCLPASQDPETVLQSVDIRVVSANAAQQCSRLAKQGLYKEARSKALTTQNLLQSSIRTDEQKALFALFQETVETVFKQLDDAEAAERKANVDVSSLNTNDLKSYRAAKRSDTSAKMMYDLKDAKSKACEIM